MVPFLLGLKFNMISIMPIIFGILAILAKKALLISKLALVASSAWALGILLFNNNQNYHNNYHNSHGHYGTLNPAFGGHHQYHR